MKTDLLRAWQAAGGRAQMAANSFSVVLADIHSGARDGAPSETIDALRQEAHDRLDSFLDCSIEMAHAGKRVDRGW